MSPRNYIIGFGLVLALLLAVTALFNRMVDPFWYFRDTTIAGVNDVKKEFALHERQVKPFIVVKEQPAALIFGSSYSEIGFDPVHPALRAIGKSYNFALAGAHWDREYCTARFALARDRNLREIIVGIHTETMPPVDCADIDAEMEHPDLRAFLLSFNALESSINTLSAKTPTHTIDGKMFYLRGTRGTAARFREGFSDNLPKCGPAQTRPSGDAAAHPAADVNLEGLRDLLRLAAARKVRVKLVSYAQHALAIENEYRCGLREQHWHVLAQVSAMTEQESTGLAQVWSFDGYHDIATEPISDAPAFWWQDSGHFNSEFGDIMLNEMFGLAPPKYGARLTSANVPSYMAAERQSRAAYLAAHPEFLLEFKSLTSGRD